MNDGDGGASSTAKAAALKGGATEARIKGETKRRKAATAGPNPTAKAPAGMPIHYVQGRPAVRRATATAAV